LLIETEKWVGQSQQVPIDHMERFLTLLHAWACQDVPVALLLDHI